MSEPKQSAAAKHWVFTLNDPEDNIEYTDVIEIWGPHCSYLVFQQEEGEEGTKHFQGYAEFTKPIRFTAIRALTKVIHAWWQKRKGTRAQARAYAMKEDTRVAGPWEHGEWTDKSGNHGQRSDLIEVAEAIKEGKTQREIFEAFPATTCRYYSNIEKCRMLYKPKRTEQMTVTLCYGKPGSGKTQKFWDSFPEGWAIPVGKDLWFNGYNGETHVLIDDFAGNIGLTQLLRILDKPVSQVPAKHGFVWWNPTHVCITTNVHPCNWYDYGVRQDSYQALKRRIYEVFHFWKEDGEYYLDTVDVEDFFENQKVDRDEQRNPYKGPKTWDPPTSTK